MAERMTAAVLTGHGGPEMLEVRDDVPVPTPARGEVQVRVAAAAVNNTDLWTREGAYGRADDPDAVAGWRGVPIEVPRIQGADVVGTVTAVGPEVEEAVIGRRVLLDPARFEDGTQDRDEPPLVAVMGSEYDGGFAEYVVVPVGQVHDVTAAPLSDEQLACLPIAYGTAVGMLERAEVTDRDTVLVTGASGGVGLALVQLATARGARVLALTSTSHEQAVRDAGAAVAIVRDADGGRETVPERVREAADDHLDVVADVVGGWVFAELFPVLATGGRWVTCGAIAEPVVDLDLRTLYLHRRRLIGSTMHTPAQFEVLVGEANAGRVEPVVSRTYPLRDIHTAQEDLARGELTGKLVLLPGR
jgi:NADPH:quinone reductase-like Zn-dependent oxidoreductase